MDCAKREFFAAEVERLADRMYGTALRLTRNADEAEELVAETVAKAWANFAELRDRQCCEAWIQRILANTFLSHWRHLRACPEVALETEDDND